MRGGLAATALCAAVAVAGCDGQSRSEPHNEGVPTIQIGYAYGSAGNPLEVGPPLPGAVPTITEQPARAAITRAADSRFAGLNVHGQLVRFGLGAARGRAADSQGDTHAFRHRRLAWIAIYRFATAGMAIPTCAALQPESGYRIVELPQRRIANLVVLVDAQTGYLATWDNLRSRCPQAVPIVRPTEGQVRGRFLAVGGPSGASTDPQRGKVILRNETRQVTVAVGPNGRFSMIAPVGRYRLLGFTPQFTINGRDGECNAVHRVVVRARHTTRANVYCQRN